MNDIISISNEIQKKIVEIDAIRKEIKERGDNKARTIAVYDRDIAIALIQLENGIEFELDGNKLKNPPKSIMDKISRGLCWKQKIEMEQADANYKSIITNLQAVEAQLNGLQSLFRYLEKA